MHKIIHVPHTTHYSLLLPGCSYWFVRREEWICSYTLEYEVSLISIVNISDEHVHVCGRTALNGSHLTTGNTMTYICNSYRGSLNMYYIMTDHEWKRISHALRARDINVCNDAFLWWSVCETYWQNPRLRLWWKKSPKKYWWKWLL